MTGYSPTIRRKRLSNALRQLRKDAGLTAEDVARRLTWNPSKISRIESNEWKLPSVGDIERLCDIYQVGVDERDALVTLARQARQRGWWEEFKDVLGGALPGLEAEAIRIRQYQPLLVPGLLQTPDYMRAVFRAGGFDEAASERRVEARLARQRILARENPPMMWVVLDESVLRKPVGGREVMRDQVHHLIEMSDRPGIGIQVLADSVGAHAGMGGPIVMLDYLADPTIVFIENSGTGDLYLESRQEVGRYLFRYGHVMASALSVEDSRQYLLRRLEQLKEGGEGHGQA